MAEVTRKNSEVLTSSVANTRLQKLSGILGTLEINLDRNSALIGAVLTAIYCVSVVALARAKPIWFDEFITLYIARLRFPAAIWQALANGVDQNPPLQHLLTAASLGMFGESELALRLPSIIAYWVMCLGLFLFVRKRLGAVYGLVAASGPLISGVFAYAYEARPYGLMLACAAVSLLAWQLATSGRRKLGLALLAASLAVGVSSHYYCVLLFVPLTIGEAYRSCLRAKDGSGARAIDWQVWAAMFLGGLPLLAYLPLIRVDLSLYKEHAWNRPTPDFLRISYPEMLRDLVWPLFGLAVIWIAWRKLVARSESGNNGGLPAHERAAAIAYIVLPVIGLLLAQIGSGQLSTRYVMTAIVGFSIVATSAVAAIARRSSVVALCCLLALFSHFIPEMFDRVEKEHRAARGLTAAPDGPADGLPIVMENPLQVLGARYYWPEAVGNRLVFPINFEAARNFKHEDSAEVTIYAGRDIFPIRVAEFEAFRRLHREYLFYGSQRNWVTERLRSEGASIVLMQEYKPNILFRVTEK